MTELRNLCVYCGSSSGRDSAYEALAVALGRLLAREQIRLIYGGGAVGLMGALAGSAMEAGGRVVGVIPRGLFRREIVHPGLTELIEVSSMHERKQAMFELADAFVGLPGGLGTLEELAEMATWSQLGLHGKPIATLDVDGYWKMFHGLLRQTVDCGFMKAENLKIILEVERLHDLLPALRAYSRPETEKWIGLDET